MCVRQGSTGTRTPVPFCHIIYLSLSALQHLHLRFGESPHNTSSPFKQCLLPLGRRQGTGPCGCCASCSDLMGTVRAGGRTLPSGVPSLHHPAPETSQRYIPEADAAGWCPPGATCLVALTGKVLALLTPPAMLLQGWQPRSRSASSPCMLAQPCSPLVQACSQDTPLIRPLLLISHYSLCIE